jgi:DNA-binding GntR family transcriptional regulator
VFTALKSQLLTGELGVGRRLGEERLAEALGVSRTPVREALHRLHAEGLVTRLADGGFAPTIPDVAAMRRLYEVRVGLEVQALRRPGSLGTRHDVVALEQLRDDWRGLRDDDAEPAPEFVLLDESFHLALAAAAGNPVIVELLGTVNDRIRIVRMQDFLTSDRVALTVEQHVEIVDAVLAADTELAVARFEEHLAESLAVVEDRTLRAIALMAANESDSR